MTAKRLVMGQYHGGPFDGDKRLLGFVGTLIFRFGAWHGYYGHDGYWNEVT